MSPTARKVISAVGRLFAVVAGIALVALAQRAAIRWIGAGKGDLLVLGVLMVIALAAWAKAPMWERYFGVLFGFPMMCAILMNALRHWFGRENATYILLAGLIVLAIWYFGLRKHGRTRRGAKSTNREEANLQLNAILQMMLVLFLLALSAGGVIGTCALFSPGAPIWVRIGDGFIGLMGLLFAYILFEIMRTLPIWGQPPPHPRQKSGHKTSGTTSQVRDQIGSG